MNYGQDYQANSTQSVLAKQGAQAAKVAIPKERAIDGVKQLVRELANQVAENTRRAEQIAARLGYHGPKSDQATPVPVPAGHLDEITQMISEIKGAAFEAVDYLNAIERQV